VALKFAIAATLTGIFSWGEVARVHLDGRRRPAVGALIGWGFSHARGTITRRLGDVAATQMVLLLVLLPFAAYIVGEKFGVSGILAAVAAASPPISPTWSAAAISANACRPKAPGAWWKAFNGAIFLLLGLQLPSIIGVPLHQAGHDWWILVGYVVRSRVRCC
jgi:CPA1 family monovalent cation:H+ antiporter